METFSWPVLTGGVALFFYGLRHARKGLEVTAGDRLRAAMGRLAGNRISALIFGAFVTTVLQSSGATSAMLVSFTETGLVNLFQASAVLLGADIGTTLVVVLLSIKRFADIALLIVAAGVAIQIFGRKRKVRDAGSIVLGFGLIFYGMHLMTLAASPLKESEEALKVLALLSAHPLATLIGSSILAAALHSAGLIGIAIALAFAGAITFEAAIPIVLGANIGSCVTAVLASLSGGAAGRRVALMHTLTKVIGVAAIFPFISHVAEITARAEAAVAGVFPAYSAGVASKIALTHILFNLAIAAFFTPLLKPLVRIVEHMIPMPPPKEAPFGPLYLDKSALQTPAIAFAQAKREIMRLGSIAQQLTADSLRMFSRGEDVDEMLSKVEAEDDKIDRLEKAIRFYLAQVTTERMSEEQARMQIALVAMGSGMEEIGDIISKEMASLAKKKARWRRLFSDQGWRDLREFQAMVMDNFNLAMLALAQPHCEIAQKLSRHEAHMNEVEQQLRQKHINRLHKGLQESFDTSSIHLDVLANLRRINSRITRIAELACEGA